ncbi:MAG: HAMP domain-containing sensor histidine kinase [Bacillota bacterium]
MLKWRPPGFFGKLLAAHLVVILITLVAVGFFFSYLVEKYFFSAHEWELTDQGEKIAEMLAVEFQSGNYEEVIKMSRTLALSMGVKIRVIDNQKNEVVSAMPQGSDSDPGVDLEPKEIDYVLQGDNLSKKVYGPATQRLLVAMPIFKEEGGEEADSDPQADPPEPEIIGAITVSAPLSSIKATVARVSRLVLFSFFFATIVAGLLAFSLSKTISRPLQAMTRAAREMAKGNFRSRISVNDTGELGQLAATFNQAVEEVDKTVQEQKRLQALRQNLVASVSHEFRAPLTSIQGFVDAMLEGFIREEERDKYLKVILSNTLHLNRLVDDLLELASIESGYIQLRREVVSPRSLAERALDTVLPQAREKEISLEHKYGENLPAIRGDQDRLYQVLVNLLENAIAYTPAGGKIVLESRRYVDAGDDESSESNEVKAKIIFMVSDNGAGIPPEEIPYIWERFYKVDKARNRAHKGKGLGLAIVRELVHLHHGQVKVDSIPEKGSTFSVILPT